MTARDPREPRWSKLNVRPIGGGLADAVRALGLERRSPRWDDAPDPSTFPMTPAAREALRMSRTGRKEKSG